MAHDTNASNHASHGVGHVVSPKVLIATCLALLVLTVVTVLVAKIDFAEYNMYELNIVVAMAVAVVKASLVCLFFMHLYWDRPFNGFVLVSSLAFVALFITFSMTDTLEYRADKIPGDGTKVQQQLQASETALQQNAESGHESDSAGHE